MERQQFRQIRCITSQILHFVLLLRCHHNQIRNFSSLIDVPKPALSSTSSSKFLILIFDISKVASVLAVSYFSVHGYTPYVATDLINDVNNSIVFLLVIFDSLVHENCILRVNCICNFFLKYLLLIHLYWFELYQDMNTRPCKLPSDNVVLAKLFSDNKKTALLQNPMAEAHGRD